MTKRWEYMHLETTSFLKPKPQSAATERMGVLDHFGKEGWELVSVTSDGCHFFFKREVVEETAPCHATEQDGNSRFNADGTLTQEMLDFLDVTTKGPHAEKLARAMMGDKAFYNGELVSVPVESQYFRPLLAEVIRHRKQMRPPIFARDGVGKSYATKGGIVPLIVASGDTERITLDSATATIKYLYGGAK